jgi:cell fate regulator YaaT (PSP1 superfamily)
MARQLKLDLKMAEVEIQADGRKATFFYIADDRVDFRELIKLYAGEFKVKVEMRQIGARQEAGKVGGIGSCGRELCCSTWLTDFKSVNTNAARYQNLSINQTKAKRPVRQAKMLPQLRTGYLYGCTPVFSYRCRYAGSSQRTCFPG